MNVNKFYVYALLDERKPGTFIYNNLIFDYEPFYIGKGNGSRMQNSIKWYGSQHNKFKTRKINKIVAASKKIILIKIKNNITEDEAFNIEYSTISLIGRHPNGPLTNLTDGGEGSCGFKHSPESIEKIKGTWFSKDKEPWNKGKKMSDEHKKILSEAHLNQVPWNKGLKMPPENGSHTHTKEHRKKIVESRCKNMYEFISPNGESYLVKSYNSFCENHNLSPGNIHAVIQKKHTHTKNWKCRKIY